MNKLHINTEPCHGLNVTQVELLEQVSLLSFLQNPQGKSTWKLDQTGFKNFRTLNSLLCLKKM